MDNFQGKYLRVIKKTNILPEGVVVWCFLDNEHEFIVKTSEDYHGVREITFDSDMKEYFRVYSG